MSRANQLAAILAGSLCISNPAASALPIIKETGTGIAAAPYLRSAQQHLKVLQELTACLKNVHDKATAEAAAPAVATLHSQMQAIKQQENKLPKPSTAIQEHLHSQLDAKQIESLCQSGISQALQLTIMQSPPCYGSQALHRELEAFLNTLSSMP